MRAAEFTKGRTESDVLRRRTEDAAAAAVEGRAAELAEKRAERDALRRRGGGRGVAAEGRELREEAEAAAAEGRAAAEGGAQALRAEIAWLHDELADRAVAMSRASQAEESAWALEAERDKARAGHAIARTVVQRRASGRGWGHHQRTALRLTTSWLS